MSFKFNKIFDVSQKTEKIKIPLFSQELKKELNFPLHKKFFIKKTTEIKINKYKEQSGCVVKESLWLQNSKKIHALRKNLYANIANETNKIYLAAGIKLISCKEFIDDFKLPSDDFEFNSTDFELLNNKFNATEEIKNKATSLLSYPEENDGLVITPSITPSAVIKNETTVDVKEKEYKKNNEATREECSVYKAQIIKEQQKLIKQQKAAYNGVYIGLGIWLTLAVLTAIVSILVSLAFIITLVQNIIAAIASIIAVAATAGIALAVAIAVLVVACISFVVTLAACIAAVVVLSLLLACSIIAIASIVEKFNQIKSSKTLENGLKERDYSESTVKQLLNIKNISEQKEKNKIYEEIKVGGVNVSNLDEKNKTTEDIQKEESNEEICKYRDPLNITKKSYLNVFSRIFLNPNMKVGSVIGEEIKPSDDLYEKILLLYDDFTGEYKQGKRSKIIASGCAKIDALIKQYAIDAGLEELKLHINSIIESVECFYPHNATFKIKEKTVKTCQIYLDLQTTVSLIEQIQKDLDVVSYRYKSTNKNIKIEKTGELERLNRRKIAQAVSRLHDNTLCLNDLLTNIQVIGIHITSDIDVDKIDKLKKLVNLTDSLEGVMVGKDVINNAIIDSLAKEHPTWRDNIFKYVTKFKDFADGLGLFGLLIWLGITLAGTALIILGLCGITIGSPILGKIVGIVFEVGGIGLATLGIAMFVTSAVEQIRRISGLISNNPKDVPTDLKTVVFVIDRLCALCGNLFSLGNTIVMEGVYSNIAMPIVKRYNPASYNFIAKKINPHIFAAVKLFMPVTKLPNKMVESRNASDYFAGVLGKTSCDEKYSQKFTLKFLNHVGKSIIGDGDSANNTTKKVLYR